MNTKKQEKCKQTKKLNDFADKKQLFGARRFHPRSWKRKKVLRKIYEKTVEKGGAYLLRLKLIKNLRF